MFKNRSKKVEVSFNIRFFGNWNRLGGKGVYTKPIVEMEIEGDTFVWKHDEILELIRAYNTADLRAIEMIKKGESGEIKSFEAPFLEKLKNFIIKLEDEKVKTI